MSYLHEIFEDRKGSIKTPTCDSVPRHTLMVLSEVNGRMDLLAFLYPDASKQIADKIVVLGRNLTPADVLEIAKKMIIAAASCSADPGAVVEYAVGMILDELHKGGKE